MHAPRRILVIAAVGAAVALSACTKKPTEEQCDAFADHLVEMLEESHGKPDSRIKKLARDKRDDVIGACVSEGSVEEVECVMAQSTLLEVEANCN